MTTDLQIKRREWTAVGQNVTAVVSCFGVEVTHTDHFPGESMEEALTLGTYQATIQAVRSFLKTLGLNLSAYGRSDGPFLVELQEGDGRFFGQANGHEHDAFLLPVAVGNALDKYDRYWREA